MRCCQGDSPGAKFLNILLEYVPGGAVVCGDPFSEHLGAAGSISQLLVSFGAFSEKVIKHYTHQVDFDRSDRSC